MNTLTTKRLTLLESAHTRGGFRCVVINAWLTSGRFPSLIVGTVLLVNLREKWLLSHLLIEDEARRNGFATEIVRFYEERLGGLDAAWVSDSGEAFGLEYVARFGPRPNWQIGKDPAVEAAIEKLLSENSLVEAKR